ncbi:hypothetical protein [Nocardia crassostreae]|uniref:hypothetical protein n=1 Tax=Nocardia crassostreae TaxID=53428 RepID=UPI0012FC4F20|nr:hypothetical protein [Nocardia crassostreae]
MLAALTVSTALFAPAAVLAAPAYVEPLALVEAEQIDESGSASGSATYSAEGVEFLVCLLKGGFTGSKYPLC